MTDDYATPSEQDGTTVCFCAAVPLSKGWCKVRGRAQRQERTWHGRAARVDAVLEPFGLALAAPVAIQQEDAAVAALGAQRDHVLNGTAAVRMTSPRTVGVLCEVLTHRATRLSGKIGAAALGWKQDVRMWICRLASRPRIYSTRCPLKGRQRHCSA